MKLDDLERLSEFEDVCISELPKLLSLIRQMKEALERFKDMWDGDGYPANDALTALEQYEGQQ